MGQWDKRRIGAQRLTTESNGNPIAPSVGTIAGAQRTRAAMNARGVSPSSDRNAATNALGVE